MDRSATSPSTEGQRHRHREEAAAESGGQPSQRVLDRRDATAAAVQLLCVRVRVIVHLNVNVRCVHDGHDLSARLLSEVLGRAAEGGRVQSGRDSRRQRVGWRIEWMRQRPQCRDLHGWSG